MPQDLVGEIQDLGRGAIVDVDGVELGSRVSLRESHDIFPIGPAPSVDALGVVADRHDLVFARQEVDDAALQPVRILEFVDQDMLKALAIVRQNGRVVFEDEEPERQ